MDLDKLMSMLEEREGNFFEADNHDDDHEIEAIVVREADIDQLWKHASELSMDLSSVVEDFSASQQDGRRKAINISGEERKAKLLKVYHESSGSCHRRRGTSGTQEHPLQHFAKCSTAA